MNFEELYKRKLVSAVEAATKVESNDNIVVGLGCGETPAVLEELAKRQDELQGVVVHQMLPLYNYRYFQESMESAIRHNAWFISGYTTCGRGR